MDLSSLPMVNYSNGYNTVQPFQNQPPISLGNYQVNNGGQLPDFNAIFSQFTNPASFDPNVSRFLAQPTQGGIQPPLINGMIPVAGGSVGPTGWQGGYNNSQNTQISTFSSTPGPVISNGQFIGSLPTTTNYTQSPTQNYVNLGNLLNQNPPPPFQTVGYNNQIFNNFTPPQQPQYQSPFPQQFPFQNRPLPWQPTTQFPNYFPSYNTPNTNMPVLPGGPQQPWQQPVMPWGQSFPQIPQFQQPQLQFPTTFSPTGYQNAVNTYQNNFNTAWNTYQGQLNQTFGQFPGYQPPVAQPQFAQSPLPDLSQYLNSFNLGQYPPLPQPSTTGSQVTVNGQTSTTPSNNVMVTNNGFQTW